MKLDTVTGLVTALARLENISVMVCGVRVSNVDDLDKANPRSLSAEMSAAPSEMTTCDVLSIGAYAHTTSLVAVH